MKKNSLKMMIMEASKPKKSSKSKTTKAMKSTGSIMASIKDKPKCKKKK